MELAEPGAPRSLRPRCRAWAWYLLPRAGARKGRPWACLVTARRQPGPVTGGCVPSQTKSSPRWSAGLREGLSHPGAGNRKEAAVWGFNQHGKNARKLYSIFPVKVIILHRTKRKKKAGGP